MDIVNYGDLLRILKNSEGKRVGSFTTTGRIHEGHISCVQKLRERCDILYMTFNYYLPSLFLQLSGLEIPSYENFWEEDIKKLNDTGLVDYVSRRSWEPSIFESAIEARKIVLEQKDLLESLGYNINLKNSTIITKLAVALRQNPDEHLCDEIIVGDDNFSFRMAQYIGEKIGVDLKYFYCTLLRDKNNIPFHSSIIKCSSEKYNMLLQRQKEKEEIKNFLNVHGKLPNREDFKMVRDFLLVDEEKFTVINLIEPKKEYFLLFIDADTIDCERVKT